MSDHNALLKAVTVDASAGSPVTDPATGELIGHAPDRSVADLDAAIAKAGEAQRLWAGLGHARRSELLLAAAQRLDESAEALARLIAREQGKPLNGGARGEVELTAVWLRAAAAAVLEPEILVDEEGTHAELTYTPIGIVGAIGPWNWPVLISAWQFAAALRMGNAVVLKPSEFTPLSVLALVHILNEVLPEGVLTALSGGRDLGARLAEHPAIGKIMFTGSTATGREIVKASANNLARLTLELGGNDAGILLDDADVEKIAGDLFWSAFLNVGQTCGALKRLYVPDALYEPIVGALAGMAGAIPMGRGTEESSALGPLNNAKQWKIVDDLVEGAKRSGARIAAGGNPDRDAAGHFYPVTIVADIDVDAPLVVREQFGPALPIIRYSDLDDAIREANRLDAGLTASVWSSDRERALEVASRLDAGTVSINRHGVIDPRIPFGGIKDSGYGLEFGIEGLKAVALPRVVIS